MSTQQSSETTSTTAGKGVGDAVKGIFNAGHGAGETIRGTINDTLDKFGDGLASDGTSNSEASRLNKLQDSNHAPQDHASVVEKGKAEFQNGVNSISHAGKGNSSSTAP